MYIPIPKHLWVPATGLIAWLRGRSVDLRPDIRLWCRENRVRYSVVFNTVIIFQPADSKGTKVVAVSESHATGINIDNKRKATLFKLWWG